MRPLPDGYPTELKTIGNHVRKGRMDRGMCQQEVAELIGVSESTIWNWESGWTSEPSIKVMPAIISYLGYVPVNRPATLCDQLRAYRMIHGMSQRQAAREVGVDTSTWERWENETATPRLKGPKAIISNVVVPVINEYAYQ